MGWAESARNTPGDVLVHAAASGCHRRMDFYRRHQPVCGADTLHALGVSCTRVVDLDCAEVSRSGWNPAGAVYGRVAGARLPVHLVCGRRPDGHDDRSAAVLRICVIPLAERAKLDARDTGQPDVHDAGRDDAPDLPGRLPGSAVSDPLPGLALCAV